MKTNKKARLYHNILFLILLFIALLIANRFLSEEHIAGQTITDAYGLHIIDETLPEDSPPRTCNQRKIKYIVIHETGNYSPTANAEAHSHYLQDGGDGNGTGWHYTVDDTIAFHHIPDDEIAYHAGRGNRYGIGIELCVNDGSDFEKTFENGAKLTAKLIEVYGLSIDDIRQHADFMDKNCPEKIRNSNRWDEFILTVKKYLKEQ